jgi:hypothetical protein
MGGKKEAQKIIQNEFGLPQATFCISGFLFAHRI